MRRTSVAFVGGLTALLVWACNKAEEGPVVELSLPADNVPTVQVSTDSAELMSIVEELRLEGSADSPFARVAGLAASEDGSLFVVDGGYADVRVYDQKGSLSARFGGRGDGPGELSAPRSIALWRDTVYILDNRGVNVFTRTGEFVRRGRPGGKSINGMVLTTLHAADDAVMVALRVRPDFKGIDGGPARGLTRIHEIRSDSVGREVVSFETHDMYKRGYMISPILFAPQPEYAVGADGTIAWAGLSGRDVEILRQGDRQRLRISAAQMPLGKDDLDALFLVVDQSTEAARKLDPNMPTAEEPRREMLSLPRLKYRPAVGRLIIGPSGVLLIERSDLSVGGRRQPGETLWNVVERSGRVLGRVSLPSKFNPVLADSVSITGTTTDSLDVQSVIRFKLMRN